MKRKIFSKLLMGAFLIASVSSFVSCKDYDDDINNLQKQIDAAALKADLTALQQTLAAQISEAKSAAAAAQAAAEAAQATANNAATKDALEAVKTAATNAGAVAAQALADAANAQNTADVAKNAAAAAQEAATAAQNVANGASDKAATALADAAKALASAEGAAATAKAAQEAAAAANANAGEAKTIAGEAKATAANALTAASNATTQAADALKAAGEAAKAAEAAKYNDEAVKLLIAQAQASADAAAEDAKDAAEAAAAAVLASASATEESAAAKAAADKIDEAIAEATKAINEATESKIATAVAEAIKGADQNEGVKELASKLEQLGNAQAGLVTKEALEEQVKDLQGKIDDATVSAETIAEVAAAAGTIEAALNEFLTAITSVELFSWNSDYLDRLDHRDLQFFWAEEVATWKFGMDLKASDKGVALTNTQMTDKTIDFTEKLVNISKDSVVIRVVPIKAELTADMICLLNTQGDTISSDFIKVCKPYRLTEKLYRGTDVEVGGLWVVPFEVNKDKFTAEIAASKAKIKDLTKEFPYAESFNKEWSDTEKTDGKYNPYKKYLYAVAVKTHQGDEEANSRRIITEHDLTLRPVMAIHAADYFEVTTKKAVTDPTTKKVSIVDYTLPITNIHNRYTYTEQERIYTTKLPEYNYMALPKGVAEKYYNYPTWFKAYAPAHFKLGENLTSREGKATNIPPLPNGNDDRQWDDLVILDLDIDNQISIDFSSWRTGGAGSTATWNSEERIRAFYVTLDADFALESKASELQAWSTYEYTNAADEKTVAIYDVANNPIAKSGKMFEGETGIITFNVPESKKEALRGEIIGFRVYAVNYDGTVVNPDGRPFYVQIKKEDAPEIKADEVNVTVTATKVKGDVSDFVEIPAAFLNKFVSGANYSWYSYVASSTPYFPNGTDMYRETTTSYKNNSPKTATVKEDFDGAWSTVDEHNNPYNDPFQVTFYQGDKKTVTNLSDPKVKYVKVTLNAEELVDDETYSMLYTLEDRDRATSAASYETVAKLKVNVKKVIDDKAKQLPAWFGVKPEAVHDGKVRICLVPSQTNGANADQAHTNYYGAGAPTDFTSTSVANAAWYQVFETLKGAKDAPEDIVLSFNNSDAFDTQATYPLNCKTDKYLPADNDGVGVSTYYYNTTPTSWLTKGGAWTAADEWSQWGTTENLYVFSNPKAAIDAANKETDPAKKQIAFQNIRNSWPKVTDVKVGAYYDNPNGPKISRTIENKTVAGSTTHQVDEKLYTAAHSVKAKVDDWMTFTYACWHHSANFRFVWLNTYEQVFSDMTLQYGLKAASKQIELSVKYGDELSQYKYYNGTETSPSNTQIAMNGTILVKDLRKYLIYDNPYLTANTGKALTEITKATLDNTIASQACVKWVSPDVNGNVYPRVVPSKGYNGTDKQLETLTYYKYDLANDKLVKRDNNASFVTPLYEYIQYHYVDFFGHDVYVEVPFYIHNK